MFSGLRVLGKPVSAPMSTEAVAQMRDRHAALQAAHRYTTARCAIVTGLAQMKEGAHDFSDLRRLGRVIKKHGINRPLMAFAAAEAVATGLPSMESLDVVPAGAGDPRTQDAILGIDTTLDTEAGLVADWVRTGADNIDTLLSSTASQIQGFGDAISYYLNALEERDVAPIDGELTAVPFEETLSCIVALLEVFPDLDALVSDPTDRDAMDAHKAKLAKIVATIGPHTGIALDPGNPHQLIDGPAGTTPSTSTFSSLGYTVENLISLLRKTDNLIDEVNGLIERKDAIVGQLTGAATLVASIDNDVPPAVDNAIDDDEGDESFGVDIDLTQADVINHHVSSHLCCISTAIDKAVCAVQNVLAVAEHASRSNDTTD